VNNAGSLIARQTLATATDDFWAETMSLNIGSMRRVSRAALPHLTVAAKAHGGGEHHQFSPHPRAPCGHPGSLAYATRRVRPSPSRVPSRTNRAARHPRQRDRSGLILGTSFHNTHTTPESAKATIAGIPLGVRQRPMTWRAPWCFSASEFAVSSPPRRSTSTRAATRFE